MERPINIFLETSLDSGRIYRRYRFNDGYEGGCGKIVLEKYGDVWNLEIMQVVPQRKGLGTQFLKRVLELEGLKPQNMTVSPTSYEANQFFIKQGFLGLENRKY